MQIERYNEVELIRQTLAGDTSAFDRLIKTHRATVYVLVLSYTKNPADAEDLTQWIFMRAYERLSTLRELDRFLPWLQRITHNACKDWLRRQNDLTTGFDAMNDADFTETVPTPEEIALKREVEAIVREAIDALKETDRKLMEGRYIEGASYDQLQAESGLSYAAIANRLKRAKQQIRRRIEKLLGGMAILPGQTFIWGGIETVKLSVKTKLAAVGIVALIGIGGGVLYHQAFESNPVVNGQGSSESEAVKGDTSTVEKPKPPSEAEIEKAITALENLDATDRLNKRVGSSGDETSSEPQLTESGAKVAPEAETSETERLETKISPELEALFLGVKQLLAQDRAIDNEVGPFLNEHSVLKRRQREILLKDLVKANAEETKRLREEFNRINKRMKTLSDIIAPFGEQKRQLWDEFKEKYGITLEEFMERYAKDYRSWKALQ